jgi:Ca-activated chloride channel family protein
MPRIRCTLFATVLIGAAPALHAESHAGEASPPEDRTLSPYFAVEGIDGTDALPLKSTDVRARVLGVIAEVVVTQVYRNAGASPLEARYVFPASTRAAVHSMNVRIGDRLITASIREKQAARTEYAAAKREGRTAALLEQHRANVFQMHVGNILPGDEVRVELSYTELLVPEDGVYRFVYPTVVGPRYNGAAGIESRRNEPWLATPHLHAGIPPATTFSLAIDMQSPVPLQSISSPSHRLRVKGERTRKASVLIEDDGRPRDDRDFVLEYRLEGDAIQSGVLLSKGPDENFFLAMIQPPASVPESMIVPREYVFILDVSGSMSGFPIDTARALMAGLLARLRPSDSFNILLFAGGNAVLAPRSVPATEGNIRHAMTTLDGSAAGGGTELLPALRRALMMPADEGRSRTFVVVTDGYVSIEDEAFELVRRNLSHANLFAFGIGSSVNRALIEGLARAGQGEPFVVEDAAAATREAVRFREMIEAPVMNGVSVRFEGLEAYDVTPTSMPDLFARRPVVVFGKWRGEARGAVIIEGTTPKGLSQSRLEINPRSASPTAGALRYLWARNRIAELGDLELMTGGSEQRDAILALGLKYGLLTKYTSFIAVDRIVRLKDPASARTVDQPLPLPKGVSDAAVGGTVVPGTPEPSTWAMLAIALLATGWALRRGGTLATEVARRLP